MFVKHDLTIFVKHNLTTFVKHKLKTKTFVKYNLTINNFRQQYCSSFSHKTPSEIVISKFKSQICMLLHV